MLHRILPRFSKKKFARLKEMIAEKKVHIILIFFGIGFFLSKFQKKKRNIQNVKEMVFCFLQRIQSGFFVRTKQKKKCAAMKQADKMSCQESVHEKRLKFAKLVTELNSDQLGKVVEMIHRKCPIALCSSENEVDDIEIEVCHINAETVDKLLGYCLQCNHTNKNKAKVNGANKKGTSIYRLSVL
ncbi:hypothetical protein RFI_20880 [Reticulomyxa filosa]|uniref:NET domain-containing protein n=1 Tax=Reticulomyxa filosa TaxID=46433 RepID=X6MR46_RETFI|nr:hypothetical protein RFI_20880 [Reticulomyxa filosa]|eukprot:ETO16458.1 hypothetical protein RFI_20880 [Reticulomyxa filosa]